MKGCFSLCLGLAVPGMRRQGAALSPNGSSLEHVQKKVSRNVETSLMKS